MSLAKVRKLLALAAQENEEGRTAAWMAAKVMREHGYRVTSARATDDEPAPREPARWSRSPDPAAPPRPAAPSGHEVRATEPGRCWECRRPWHAGDPIYKPARREPVCLECAERRL